MREKTKEIIWKEALILFSKHGYEGVSVKTIANAVGIKDSSLYKHYKSKQEIFDTIINKVKLSMEEARNRLAIPISADTAKKYQNINIDILVEMCSNLISYYLKDEVISNFRKMLIIEQYHNSQVGNLYQEIFIDGALEFETNIFKEFIRSGHFKNGDPYIMAIQFYSPIFLLISKFDKCEIEMEKLHVLINALVRSFVDTYTNQGVINEE